MPQKAVKNNTSQSHTIGMAMNDLGSELHLKG